VIRKVGGKFVLFTADGSRRLGTHPSRASAERQERAVQASKHAGGRGGVDPHKLAAFARKHGGGRGPLPGGMNVPPVEQETDYSCGAAALLAVLRYYGLDDGASEEDLYGRLRTTPEEGTAPDDISRVANEFGLQANWRTGVGDADLRAAAEEGVPVILNLQAWDERPDDPESHVEDGHYVVLVAATDAGVEFMDPSAGDYETLTLDELDERWHDVEGERGAIFVGQRRGR
jgi:predicted double-glycine peptidase